MRGKASLILKLPTKPTSITTLLQPTTLPLPTSLLIQSAASHSGPNYWFNRRRRQVPHTSSTYIYENTHMPVCFYFLPLLSFLEKCRWISKAPPYDHRQSAAVKSDRIRSPQKCSTGIGPVHSLLDIDYKALITFYTLLPFRLPSQLTVSYNVPYFSITRARAHLLHSIIYRPLIYVLKCPHNNHFFLIPYHHQHTVITFIINHQSLLLKNMLRSFQPTAMLNKSPAKDTYWPDLLVTLEDEVENFAPSKMGFGGTARSGTWGAGAAPTAATVAVVGSMRADMVANMPLGCRRSGEVKRPAAGPDGQQQFAGRYTLAWNGGGLIAEGKSISDSVLTANIKPRQFKYLPKWAQPLA